MERKRAYSLSCLIRSLDEIPVQFMTCDCVKIIQPDLLISGASIGSNEPSVHQAVLEIIACLCLNRARSDGSAALHLLEAHQML